MDVVVPFKAATFAAAVSQGLGRILRNLIFFDRSVFDICAVLMSLSLSMRVGTGILTYQMSTEDVREL